METILNTEDINKSSRIKSGLNANINGKKFE